ncbi:subtilase family-domain-containing protein [Phycomyces blakesleeanus]|uniref:tripeptidyl-peptidase II n=1 Tax=Phycomyces blakesleeanus TaxID=4837 RepID=A0ABR3B426_PHYBL
MTSISKYIQEYPVNGLMPKQETQAASFIKKYPNYDGVDPGAAGMQITTDGKPKIIDIVDCTGGGDVNTSAIVKAQTEEDGDKLTYIQALSGRKLIIDPTWKCPSGEYHVGVKPAYELFPTELVNRLKKERSKAFDARHLHLVDEAKARVCSFTKQNSSKLTSDPVVAAELADLETRVEVLKGLKDKYEDPGVILDCVVFNDGQDWRAVIDLQESGDLRGQPCLTDYRKEFKYHTFGETDLLNFSVNIYEDGNLLSIVTLAGSHGTHVAGITAANFPEEPALNGVAPGAQIVSLRIGDARLGSMETGPGLTRAALHLAINKVDLANMSYGESSASPTDGHFIKLLAEEAIAKSGCIFVTSAGNDGPCYSSIGAPAGMHSSFITVGAYVKHSQMQAEYALLESMTEQPYTWSSRGPCTDGYSGVDIYAPGSAITSVPVYGLHKLDLKNGTSMSSPNACGCVSLLVSGLKAEKRDYSPYRVKAAVVQSAKSVKDPLNVGFLQVEKAWEYLDTYKSRNDQDIAFEITVSKRGPQRGIYLREREETNQVQYLPVTVKPTFMAENNVEDPKYNRAKFNYEARIALVATESWISAPDYLYLHSGGNSFQVKVDPLALKENEFHFGEVLGYDTTAPDRGPVFRVPVYVVKPVLASHGSLEYKKIAFGPGDIVRNFVHVPEGAAYCQLTIRSKSLVNTVPARFMLHLLQLIPKKSQKNKQTYSFVLGSGTYSNSDSEEEVIVKRFAVRGGLNLEVCLAQFWSALGKHTVDLSLEFHGVQLAGNLANGHGVVYFDPQVTRLDVAAPIRKENKVDISVSFNKLRKYIRPYESEIAPLYADRDMLPDKTLLYALVLSYKLKVDASNTMVVRFPTVMNQLYEHYLAGVFGIVYDANCKVIGYLDVFDQTIKLDNKGEYTIRLQLMTEEQDVLEKLKNTVCQVDLDVKAVTFNVHKSMADVYRSDKSTCPKVTLERKDTKALFVAAPLGELPKEAKHGDALVGKISFTSNRVDGGQYSAVYPVPPTISEPKKKEDKADKPDDEKLKQNLEDAIRDLQISYLKKLSSGSDAFKSVLSHLEENHGKSIGLYEQKIEAIWTVAGGRNENIIAVPSKLTQEQAKEISSLADSILEQINQNELFAFFGRQKSQEETDEAKEKRKENEKKKSQVIKALKNKAAAWAAVTESKDQDSEFETCLTELNQLASDDSNSDITSLLIKVKKERLAGRFGNALKAVQAYVSESSVAPDSIKNLQKAWELRRLLFEDLEWSIWAENDAKLKTIRAPPGGYAPF